MDLNIIIGVIIAAASIYLGVPDIRQDPLVYLQLNSFILVLGGTIGSTLISTSPREFYNLGQVYYGLIFGERFLVMK